jgi:hypothetical protein
VVEEQRQLTVEEREFEEDQLKVASNQMDEGEFLLKYPQHRQPLPRAAKKPRIFASLALERKQRREKEQETIEKQDNADDSTPSQS